MYTIGQMAKRFSISRSTLLYYDSIGLLSPGGRSEAGYRLYSDVELRKMEKIALYRQGGLSLNAIKQLVDVSDKASVDSKNAKFRYILEQRLALINNEIQNLRSQQQVILHILESESAVRQTRVVNKEIWVSILSAAGLDDNDMKKWHIEFERKSPEAHQDFLESLGIDFQEIAQIRQCSSQSL